MELNRTSPKPALFAAAGELLHGPEWQPKLARDLDMSLRTVQRIAEAARLEADHNVPAGAMTELVDLLKDHRDRQTANAQACNYLQNEIAAFHGS